MKFKSIILLLLISLLVVSGCSSSKGSAEKVDDLVSTYQERSGISLVANDLNGDIKSHLDKDFVIAGIANISDYYNYGFKFFEDKWFSVRLSPVNGSDDWYLYFDKSNDSKLFSELKNNRDILLVTAASVPSSIYTDGQGKMAIAASPVWSSK